jgi:hypothetical protein
MIGSRLSILPLSMWSNSISLGPRLGKLEALSLFGWKTYNPLFGWEAFELVYR